MHLGLTRHSVCQLLGAVVVRETAHHPDLADMARRTTCQLGRVGSARCPHARQVGSREHTLRKGIPALSVGTCGFDPHAGNDANKQLAFNNKPKGRTMLPTIYAQKILGDHPSTAFIASALNGPVDIWDQTCTAINGWCSNEAVYKAWDAMGRPDTEDFMPVNYGRVLDPDMRRDITAEARISAIARVIEDQLYGLILDKLFSGKLKVVAATLIEGPEDPHGATWVEGGIPGIIECDCYVMQGDEE